MITTKFFKLSSLVLVATIVLTSCGGGPKPIAKKFLEALESEDYDEAAKHATTESKETLDWIKDLGSDVGDGEKAEGGKIEITEVTELGDTAATVAFTVDGEDGGSLDMVKEDGKWKVDYDLFGDFDMSDFDIDMGMDTLDMEMDTTEMMEDTASM